MAILELLKALSHEHSSNDWYVSFQSILNDPTCKISDEMNEFDVSYVLGTTNIQMNSTLKANKKIFGFFELVGSLEKFNLKEKVIWVSVSCMEWVGRCILNIDKTKLIGCAFVGRLKESPLKTPPDWDGTQEMLIKYNNEKKT